MIRDEQVTWDEEKNCLNKLINSLHGTVHELRRVLEKPQSTSTHQCSCSLNSYDDDLIALEIGYDYPQSH
ncbi:CLUMA_CG009531, isoform A [Clunio marinus]|uniref:CLUMA_CG009531, isoform A n=1 Tax=Clunio marinus TaxID=568069 RepID=A0A1J1I710_9DIPT|nr:CLUMA_CG009531, isoform A [Clunio marinus]